MKARKIYKRSERLKTRDGIIVPKGYTFLATKEKIQDGDMCYSYATRKWKFSERLGLLNMSFDNYITKIKT
jgi:hypothetical protein